MRGVARSWQLLAAIVLGQFIVVMSTNIVAVALPAIGSGVDARPTGLQWIINSFLLVFTILMIPGGVLADRRGRKGVLLAGMGTFGVGSLICGVASSLDVLVAGRVISGIGPALFQPAGLAIVRVAFDDEHERATAVGIWAACSGLALAVGPTIGGLVVDGFGWRWVFLLNIPFVAVVLLGAGLAIPRRRAPSIHSRFDWIGLALVTSALTLLSVALIQAQDDGWTSPPILAAMVAAAALLVAFAGWESWQADPMVDVSLFRIPTYAGANLAALVVFFSFVGAIVYLSTFFQEVQDMSASIAGLHVLPIGCALAIAAAFSPRIYSRRGAKFTIVGGLVVCGLATLALVRLESDSGATWVTLVFVLLGAGAGLALAPLNNVAISVVESARAGMASGVLSTMRQLGQLLGVAILGALAYSAAPDGAAGNPEGYVDGLRTAMLTAGVALLLAAALAAAIFPRRLTVVETAPFEPVESTAPERPRPEPCSRVAGGPIVDRRSATMEVPLPEANAARTSSLDQPPDRAAVVIQRRVEWVDTDAGGIYHWTAACRLAEAAESALHTALEIVDSTYGAMPRLSVSLDFKRPLRFNDVVQVRFEVLSVGRSSVVYGFTIVGPEGLAASGEITACLIDRATRRATPWPPDIRDRLATGGLQSPDAPTAASATDRNAGAE